MLAILRDCIEVLLRYFSIRRNNTESVRERCFGECRRLTMCIRSKANQPQDVRCNRIENRAVDEIVDSEFV